MDSFRNAGIDGKKRVIDAPKFGTGNEYNRDIVFFLLFRTFQGIKKSLKTC